MQKPRLEFVSTIQDIKKNIKTFNERAKDNLGTIKKDYLKKQRRYWVYDSDTFQFGPGKFVAYRNMDFELRNTILEYQQQSEEEQFKCNRVVFTGGAAHKRITKVVREELGTRKEFHTPDKSLINEFENWADQLDINLLLGRLGTDLSSVITDKYKFLEV